MKQFFQVLVVALQAAQDDAVVVGQGEEGAGDPAGRHRHAQLTPAIVLDDADAFKAQLLDEGGRVALNLQSVAVLPVGAKLPDAPLAQHLALMENDHRLADLFDVAE